MKLNNKTMKLETHILFSVTKTHFRLIFILLRNNSVCHFTYINQHSRMFFSLKVKVKNQILTRAALENKNSMY